MINAKRIQEKFMNCFIVSVFLFAALPPGVQSSREIIAILKDPRTFEALGNAERIEQINRTEEGYEIKTTHKTVSISIEYKSQDHPGPALFELHY